MLRHFDTLMPMFFFQNPWTIPNYDRGALMLWIVCTTCIIIGKTNKPKTHALFCILTLYLYSSFPCIDLLFFLLVVFGPMSFIIIIVVDILILISIMCLKLDCLVIKFATFLYCWDFLFSLVVNSSSSFNTIVQNDLGLILQLENFQDGITFW